MDRIKGTTRLVGIFGDKISYTLSPRMHNHAFAKLGLDFAYVPFEVRPDQLKGAVRAVRDLNLAGVNVTIPHKQAVIPLLDRVSPEARKIGAVNVIVNKNGKLWGDNTDSEGFLKSLTSDGKYAPKGKKVLMVGAGGAACAMATALLGAGASKLTVLNRTLQNAQALARQLLKHFPKADVSVHKLSEGRFESEIPACDLLVNATPSGLDFVPASFKRFLSPHLFVFDAVYAQATPLVLAARESGIPALGGLGMLIHQGALAFSLWTGEKPPVELMREALMELPE